MFLKDKKIKLKLNIYQVIAITYLLIILVGASVLALPISLKTDLPDKAITVLFTATSAVCVTGLSLVDIWSTYTTFGQAVLLLLMEIGGLGFMSFVSILIHLTKHQDDINSLSLSAESLGSGGMLKSISRVQKRLLIGSAIFESLGAFILFICLLPSLKWYKALWFGIFHSVSAFCNAGFDLMGIFSPGSSLTTLQNNPIALLTISALIIVGGIGFVVWDDIVSSKHIKNWSIYTKLVMLTSLILTVSGFLLFFCFEYNNPDSIGNMNIIDKLANSLFQSATTRTAGFAAIDQANLSDASIALTTSLMLIGGSTGSTAGGIKTVTFAIIILSMLSSTFGKKRVTIFKRTVSSEQIINAYTIACCFLCLGAIGGMIIHITSDISLTQCLFESISALATVGLSLGITGSVSFVSQILLIIFMYIGRVGLLTLTIGFLKAKENAAIKYPSVNLLIG